MSRRTEDVTDVGGLMDRWVRHYARTLAADRERALERQYEQDPRPFFREALQRSLDARG